MAKRFDDDAIRRISDSVKWSEAVRRGNGYGDRRIRPTPPGFRFGIAKAAAAHGEMVAVSILADIKAPDGPELFEVSAYVWGCPVEVDDQVILGEITGTLAILSLYRGA